MGAFAEAVAESEQGVAPALAKLFAAFSQNSPKEEEIDADDPFAAMDRKRQLATFPGRRLLRGARVTPRLAPRSCAPSARWRRRSRPETSRW